MAPKTIDPNAEPKKGKGIMGLLMNLIMAIVLVAAGFGAGFFYFANPLTPSEDLLRLIEPAAAGGEEASAEEGAAAHGEEAPHKVPKPVPEEEKFQTSYYTFADPITSNLRDSQRFLQIQIGVSTQYDPSVVANVEAHKLALQSDMLAVISTFSEADIDGPDGRALLGRALRDAINARLEKAEGFGGIEDVFFPSFMIQ